MESSIMVRRLLGGAAFFALWVCTAQAQANRVFASARSGNDANACSNILTPCQTFQGAINQVAAGGTVIVLDSGGYGPMSITKSVTVDAPPGIVAFIHPPSGDAVTVSALAGDAVVLRGIALNVGTGNGITVVSVGSLRIEGCTIDGFNQGLVFVTGGQLVIKDTTVSNNAGAGVVVTALSGTANAAIDHCRFERNGNGSQTGGVVAGDRSSVTVRDSVAAGNFRGFQGGSAGGQTLQLNLESCVSTSNVVGVFAADNAGTVVRVSDSTITNNTLFGLEAQGSGTIISRVTNTVEGNAGGQAFSGTYSSK